MENLQIILKHAKWGDLSSKIIVHWKTIETLHVISSFYRNSVFIKAIEAKKRSYEGSNLVNRVNWVNELNRAGNIERACWRKGDVGNKTRDGERNGEAGQTG